MRPAFGRPRVGVAKPVVVDGFRFASKGEADRYRALMDRVPTAEAAVSDQANRLVCLVAGTNRVIETFQLVAAGRNKFGAVKTPVGDKILDSKKEAFRYVQLQQLERAGEIGNLRTQVPYTFVHPINGEPVGTYTADFEYIVLTGPGRGELVTEDSKGGGRRRRGRGKASRGTRTEAYQMRKRMMWVFCRVPITET